MSAVKPAPVVGVCATCPWRREHHGKPHPAGWYTLANLRRLWNGIRSGAAPGMVCHSTDPASAQYGSTKPVPETATPRECGGALALMYRETKRLGDAASYKEYRAGRKFPMSRPALSSKGPPEFPGLMAASVWITSRIGRPVRD